MIEYVVGTAAALMVTRASYRLYRMHLRPKLKGYFGELSVKHDLNKLPWEGTIVLHDLLLPTGRDTTQLDHVVVSKYGIYAIETKNYSGLISGNEWDRTWEQLTDRSFNPIPNPVRQNYKHSLALKKVLSAYPRVPIYPVVVFSNNSRLDVTSERTLVVNRRDLLSGLMALSQNPVLTGDQMKHIQTLLENANIVDRAGRRNHRDQAQLSKALFGSNELSKAYEEGKSSPVVHFTPQLSLNERVLQDQLQEYHNRGALLTIRGKTDTIDSFLLNARRTRDNTIAEPGAPADHLVCPYTDTILPISELDNLEKGLWLSFFTKNPELADYIASKEGFSEVFPNRTRGAAIAAAYSKAPASFTTQAKNTVWYQNLAQELRKPAVETQIKDAIKQGARPSLPEEITAVPIQDASRER